MNREGEAMSEFKPTFDLRAWERDFRNTASTADVVTYDRGHCEPAVEAAEKWGWDRARQAAVAEVMKWRACGETEAERRFYADKISDAIECNHDE